MEYVYQVDNWTLSTWCNEINKLGPVVRLYITISPVIFNDIHMIESKKYFKILQFIFVQI